MLLGVFHCNNMAYSQGMHCTSNFSEQTTRILCNSLHFLPSADF